MFFVQLWRKWRKQRPFPWSYIHLYEALTLSLRGEINWILSILALLLFINWALSPLLTLSVFDQVIAMLAIAMAVGVMGYGLFILFVTMSIKRNPKKYVPRIAILLLITVAKPFAGGRGLAYREVKHLQRVAKVEQGAADWRASFINVFIIGSISIAAALYTYYSNIRSLGANLNEPPSPWAGQDFLPWVEALFGRYRPLILILLVLWLIISLFEYLRSYLAAELPNRITLLACEEVLALLEAKKLTERSSFSLREKRALASYWGYRLIQQERAGFWDRLYATYSVEENGTTWRIVPPFETLSLPGLALALGRYSRAIALRWFRRK